MVCVVIGVAMAIATYSICPRESADEWTVAQILATVGSALAAIRFVFWGLMTVLQ